MPDGTEMPAPVSATTEPRLADELGQARALAPPARDRVGAPPPLSCPVKRGARLPRKAAMPSLASVAGEHRGERPLLGLDARVEVAGGRRRA